MGSAAIGPRAAGKGLRRSTPPRRRRWSVAPRIVRESIGSTQSHAVAEVRRGAPPGSRVVARRQSDGAGRGSHRWASPPGGLYLSEVRAAPDAGTSLLPISVGVELAQTLAVRYGVHSLVKWPNDLLVLRGRSPRKLSGILCDAVAAPWGPAVVVGVGLNVSASASDFPLELRRHVVGLSEILGTAPDLDELEGLVVTAIDRAVRAVAHEPGRNRVLRLARESLYGLGRRASIDGQPVGVIRGLDDEGALLVGNGFTDVVVRTGGLAIEEAP